MARRSLLYRLSVWLAAAAQAVAQTGQYGGSLSSKSVDLFAASHPSLPALPSGIARFDTWVVRLPTPDLSESVYGDHCIVEREQRRIVLERFVRDYFRHIYVGYMVTLEWIPELNSLQVAFSAATGPPAVNLPAREIWRITSPARYPVPQTIKWGDEISVPLAHVEKGVELIDYIQFGVKDKIEPRKSAPRDFYDDSAEFLLKTPTLKR